LKKISGVLKRERAAEKLKIAKENYVE